MININLLESVTDRPRGVAVVEKKVASNGSQTLLLALVVFGLLVISLAGNYFITYKAKKDAQNELEHQQAIAAQMAAIIKEQEDLKKKTQEIQARIEVIKSLRSSQQGPGAVLNALKERIDMVPGLYLESVEQKDAELVIRGNSPNEDTVTRFGRSLEFSSGLFSNLSIETVRKEMTFATPASYTGAPGAPGAPAAAPGAPVPQAVTVDFTIKCAYTPGSASLPQSAGNGTSPAANQVAQK